MEQGRPTTNGPGHYFSIPEGVAEQLVTISYSHRPLSIACTGETEYAAELQGLSKWGKIAELQLLFRSDIAPLNRYILPAGGDAKDGEFRFQARDTTVDLGAIHYIIEGRAER